MLIRWGRKADYANTIHAYNQRGFLETRFLSFTVPIYASYGIPFLYTAANWAQVTWHLESFLRATSGTVYFRLYNETDGTEVALSETSTASTSFTRLRTVALTLTDGKLYRLQFGKVSSDAGEVYGGKLIGYNG